jgi:hypothetical protein
MLKKILKEATRIEQWQQEVYTALHNIDAAWVTTGTFDVARIPDLDASKITSGTFDVARIPNLDASKITSGTFALDRIPRLDLTKMPLGSSGYFLKGQGTADPIYALLTAADIPALDASKITTGTFDVARIPDLDASKITSGIFDLARIPNIDWSRISANFPRTIAELLSDHDLTHHPLSILPRMDLSHMPLGASGYFLKGQGTADPVYALLTATDIPSLDASKITSGRFELARLPTSATANRFLVVRTANADPVYDALVAGDIPGLDASKITSGTFDVARIPDLDASKITSGRFPVSRLPDGTSGYVLVGQGAGYDLAWKDISEIAGVITDSQHGTKTGIPFAHHGDWGHYGKIPTSAPTGVSERAYVDSANLYVHDGTSWVLRATKDWNSLINKPSTFPPSAHTHSRSDVTDFWSSPFWTNIPDKPSTYPPSAHTHARADVTDFWSSPFWGNIPDKPSTFPPSAHASSHASGGADAVSLDASQITSGRLSLSRIPTSATANRILLVRTANADPVYDALVAGDIPSLDASKIVSGTFDEARIPHTFNLDVTFNSRGLGAGLRMLYAGDETEKSVSGTTETEIKTFRMIYNTSHGRKYTRVYFIGEAYVTGGTGYMKVSIDGAASTTVWTITATSYALHEGYIDVSWSDDSIHTVSVRLANSGSYTTYNRTLEVYTE